jgi:predicted RNA binding protein YcfA (HicA-like mRNA interferase family)
VIPKTSDREVNKILKEANRNGWRIVQRNGGHIICYAPNGDDRVTVSASHSDSFALKKVRADFKRAGLET